MRRTRREAHYKLFNKDALLFDGRGLPYGSGLGLSRCLGPGECLHSFFFLTIKLCRTLILHTAEDNQAVLYTCTACSAGVIYAPAAAHRHAREGRSARRGFSPLGWCMLLQHRRRRRGDASVIVSPLLFFVVVAVRVMHD